MADRSGFSPFLLIAMMFVSALIGGGVVAATAGLWAPSRGGGSDVRGYLLEHPQVLREAMVKLQEADAADQAKKAKVAVAKNGDSILDPFHGAWIGNPNGDVVIAMYTDYACPYCRASLPNVEQLVATDPRVKVVFREWPILSQNSALGASWALAAAEQGQKKYFAFHKALVNADKVTDAMITAAAQTAGLDMAKAQSAAKSQIVAAEIAKNNKTAQEIGATGTPAWVIGDQVISGAMDLDSLRKAVAEARNKS